MYPVFVQLLHSGRGSPLLAQLPRLLDSLRMRLAQLDNVRSRLVQLQARKQHMHGYVYTYIRVGSATCACSCSADGRLSSCARMSGVGWLTLTNRPLRYPEVMSSSSNFAIMGEPTVATTTMPTITASAKNSGVHSGTRLRRTNRATRSTAEPRAGAAAARCWAAAAAASAASWAFCFCFLHSETFSIMRNTR